jgi:hypothetical protein
MPQTTQYVRMPRWQYWTFPDPPRPPPLQDPDSSKPEQQPSPPIPEQQPQRPPVIKSGGGSFPIRPRPKPGF